MPVRPHSRPQSTWHPGLLSQYRYFCAGAYTPLLASALATTPPKTPFLSVYLRLWFFSWRNLHTWFSRSLSHPQEIHPSQPQNLCFQTTTSKAQPGGQWTPVDFYSLWAWIQLTAVFSSKWCFALIFKLELDANIKNQNSESKNPELQVFWKDGLL